MAHNVGKYKEVKTLPTGAQSVATYCERQCFTNAWFYKIYREFKTKKRKYVPFTIVVWQKHNYVVPKSKKQIELLKQKHPKNLV